MSVHFCPDKFILPVLVAQLVGGYKRFGFVLFLLAAFNKIKRILYI